MCATVQRSNLENFILNFCEFYTLKKNWLASALRRYDIRMNFWWRVDTGKSLSEALIFESTNPQYNERLFIELRV